MDQKNGSIIVVGASAGGVEALTSFVSQLPSDFPSAVFVVLHIPQTSKSALVNILDRAASMKVLLPEDGAEIQYNHIYVAPPGSHLLIQSGHISLSQGPKENGHRPAIDPLFRSAAKAYGNNVIGIVLSGTRYDGTAGLLAIKSRGGISIVQSPEEALFGGMPENAINNDDVDYILPLSKIVSLLVKLVSDPNRQAFVTPASEQMKSESKVAELDLETLEKPEHKYMGNLSSMVCPACGGSLWAKDEGTILRFRCRVGHAWSEASLLMQQSDEIEEALWTAFRTLEETASLRQRLAKRARERNQDWLAERYEREEKEFKQRASLIREVLLHGISKSNEEFENL